MQELAFDNNEFELNDQLDERLIYGQYPEVITIKNNREKENYLREITTSYLYKDILELENIRYPMKILLFPKGGKNCYITKIMLKVIFGETMQV